MSVDALIPSAADTTQRRVAIALSEPGVRAALARTLAASVAVLATLVLVGWQLDLVWLKSVGRGLVAMNPATAVGLILAALALHLRIEEGSRSSLLMAHLCAGAVVGIGVLRLVGYLFGWEVGIDQLLFRSALARTEAGGPNRMAPNTALGFTVIGISVLMLDFQTRAGRRPAPACALFGAALGLLAMIGYAYSQDALYRVATFIPMAVHTAVALVLLSTAILIARLDRGFTAVLLYDSAGGTMARRLLPAAIALPFVLGWLRLGGERLGLYPSGFGTALFAVTIIMVFAALILRTSWSLDRSDALRRRAEVKLQSLNQSLEERVHERTMQLETANRELHDEAHIAADLARVGRELIASLGDAKLPDRLCQLTMTTLGCDFSHVFLYRRKEDIYVPVAGCGDTEEQWAALRPLEVPRALVAKLIAHLERHDAAQVRMADPEDLLPPSLPGFYGITLTLYLAIRQGDQTVGILTAGYRGRDEPFSARQERTGRGIAHLASLTLENARLLEQLERASRLKSDFVSTMSHELRTPLNAIIGYTSLLRDHQFDPVTTQQGQVLQRVEHAADELLELVQHVLDLSRLEKDDVALDVRQVGLRDLRQELDAFARVQPHAEHVRFIWDLGTSTPSLSTDGAKLGVVLKVLIDNAFKFTEAGQVEVTSRALDGGFQFVVRDSGIGIAPAHHEIIFEPFRQLEPYLTRRYGGVGLGLYLARRLLDALGGTITVESALGQGTTFRVWVPQARSKDGHQRFDDLMTVDEPVVAAGGRWVGHA